MLNLLKFQFYFQSPIILSGNPFSQIKAPQKIENIMSPDSSCMMMDGWIMESDRELICPSLVYDLVRFRELHVNIYYALQINTILYVMTGEPISKMANFKVGTARRAVRSEVAVSAKPPYLRQF
jgi:hypothetical protein